MPPEILELLQSVARPKKMAGKVAKGSGNYLKRIAEHIGRVAGVRMFPTRSGWHGQLGSFIRSLIQGQAEPR
jgi:hypothetical protein